MLKLGVACLWAAWLIVAVSSIVGGFMVDLALGIILLAMFLAITGWTLLELS